MNTIAWILLYPFIAFFVGIALMGYSLKFTARVHRRYGPPFYQPIYDILKLMSKRTNVSHGWMHDVSVVMLLGGTLLTLYFIPVPGFHYYAQFGDMIVIMYIMLVPSLGMALGVGEAANPNGSIGISRALQMLLGYDIVFILSFVGMAILNNTTSMYQLMLNQQAGGLAGWGLFSNPFLGLAGLIALQGMMHEEPFEVIVAPHEIGTGPMAEMGGKYLGLMFIQHAISIFITLAIYINLFLGGATNWIELLAKMAVLFTALMCVNVVYGRFRTDDAIKFFWKVAAPLGLIGLVIVLIKVNT